MAINMGRAPFQRVQNTLIAGASAAIVGEADTSSVKIINLSVAVAGFALTGLEVWARSGSDIDSPYFPLVIPSPAILAYGRSDAGTDPATTPAGAAAFIQVDATGWGGVQVRAKSAGAAVVTVTAGGG